MINKNQFIPKNLLQPNYYKLIFTNWCAIYINPKTNVEYQIECVTEFLSNKVKCLEILQQNEKNRSYVTPETFTTYKKAVEKIEKLIIN